MPVAKPVLSVLVAHAQEVHAAGAQADLGDALGPEADKARDLVVDLIVGEGDGRIPPFELANQRYVGRQVASIVKPEVVLLGTGAKQQFARPDLYRALIQARIAVEFMNTPAACRTYNILVAEDRKVIAAILL